MRILNLIVAAILLLLVFCFYNLVYQNAINVPFFDDFSYFQYLLDLKKAPNIIEFLRLLEVKHNGHGVVTAKLVFWLQAQLNGQLNFRTLTIAGSDLVLLLVYYFYYILRQNQLPFFYLLPVGFFLISPAYYENIFWAAALWQYVASFVVGLLVYWTLANGHFWVAVVLGCLLTYTNGNGFVGMGVAALIPLLQHKYKQTIVWLLACGLISTLFYWYYPYGLGSIAQPHTLQSSVLTVVSFWGILGIYLRNNLLDMALLGGGLTVALFGGLSWLAGVFLWQFWQKTSKNALFQRFTGSSANLSLVALLAWLGVTAVGVAATRHSNELATAPRYIIYSAMTCAAVYVATLVCLPKRWQMPTAVVSSLFGAFIAIGSYVFAAPKVVNFRKSLQADAYSLRHHQRLNGKLEMMSNAFTLNNLNKVQQQGLYVIPNTQFDNITQLKADTSDQFAFEFDHELRNIYEGVKIAKIRNKNLSFSETHLNNGVYVLLKSKASGQVYVVAPVQNPSHNRRAFLQSGRYFGTGFEASIFQQNVPDGSYHIGLLFCEGQQRKVVYTRQYITLDLERG